MKFDIVEFINWNYGVFFAILLLVIFIIQNKTVMVKMRRFFILLAAIVLLESVMASVEYQMGNRQEYNPWRFVLTFFVCNLKPMVEYLIIVVMLRDESRLVTKTLLGLPLLILTVLTAISPINGIVFSYGPDNRYIEGPLGKLPVIVLIFYIAVIVVIGIGKWKTSKRESAVIFYVVAFVLATVIFTVGDVGINIQELTLALAVLGYFMYFMSRNHIDELADAEIENSRKNEKMAQHMLSEIIETLSDTIDEKDEYTRGHSSRVADYSKRIAEMAGKSEQECQEIYYAALLHDIGKIGIPEEIINKPGKLSDDEYEVIKTHPKRGAKILEKLEDMPFLVQGAKYHHERYDGKGYPEKLAGYAIPSIGRIIAVADAYDAMTSDRSYRRFMPQAEVREQIWKGSGSQFDPKYAKLMLRLIDEDHGYDMREKSGRYFEMDLGGVFRCKKWWETKTPGIRILDKAVTVSFNACADRDAVSPSGLVSVVLFDSEDGRISGDKDNPGKNMYREFAGIRADGNTWKARALRIESHTEYGESRKSDEDWYNQCHSGVSVKITAVKSRNNAYITMETAGCIVHTTVALPDTYSWLYMSLTGEYLELSNITMEYDVKAVDVSTFTPIENSVSPLEGTRTGNIPSIDCSSWRAAHTRGIEIGKDQITLSYKVTTYPSVNRIWHSSVAVLYSSADRTVSGTDCRELFLLKSDGENRALDESVSARSGQFFSENFENWEAWLNRNKEGAYCTLTAVRFGRIINLTNENSGVRTECVITLPQDYSEPVYLTLTGELCTLTEINI